MKKINNNCPSKAKKAIATAVASLLLGFTTTGVASIDSKMDSIFHDMTNVTAPGKYNTARRGILSGGSIINRSKLVDTQLYNIAPPYISAGCGGIDIFGGSFSFINADQFVELLRSIAANAKGYAFKVALDAASSFIGVNLDELQRALQALNAKNINSCELAQGIVNSGAHMLGIKTKNNTELASALHNFAPDFAAAKDHFVGTFTKDVFAASNQEGNENLKKDLDRGIGNFVYQTLKKQNARGMFLGADSDATKEYEFIMSITGTVVVSEPKDAQDNAAVQNFDEKYIEASIQNPEELLKGGTLEIIECGSDKERCLDPQIKPHANVTGLRARVNDVLTGVAEKLKAGKRGSAADLTDDEKKIWYNLPSELSTMMIQLADLSQDSVPAFQEKAVTALMGKILYDDMLGYIDATLKLIGEANINPEIRGATIKHLTERRTNLANQQKVWYQANPSMADVTRLYADGLRRLTTGGKPTDLVR